MNGHDGDLLGPLLLVLAATLAIAALLRRLGLSTIAGYLAAGSLLGPFGLAWLEESRFLAALADVGVAFLLFTIGLELSLRRLRAMARLAFGLGTLQVGICTVVAAAIAFWIGASIGTALLIGGAVAMSSTAMGLAELNERGELDAAHGRASLAILLLQDLATVGFLALVASMRAGEQAQSLPFGALVAEGAWRVGLLLGVVFVGYMVVRPALRWVASARSPELLLLAALVVALGAAWVAELAGVTLALGAFLAGTVLAETEFRHQLESDIRPFRDVLLGLFFLTTGALLDPRQLVAHGELIAAALVALVLGKLVIIAALSAGFGLDRTSSVRTGLALAHMGEFGLLLLGLGLRERLIEGEAGQVLLATATVGFLVGSVLTRHNGALAAWLLRVLPQRSGALEATAGLGEAGQQMSGHVLICGYGRVGQRVAHLVERMGAPWIALDLDPVRVIDAHRGGEAAYLADAARTDVLRSAGLARAAGVAVALNDARAAEKIVRAVRADRGPAIPIVARVRDEDALEDLMGAGATIVLPVALEASLGLAVELLIALGHTPSATTRLAQEVRRERYAPLRTYYPGADDAGPTAEDSVPFHRHSWTVPEGAPVVGRPLSELDCGPASVAFCLRDGEPLAAREPLASGDVLVLEGTEEALAEASDRLTEGAALSARARRVPH